MQKQYLKFRGKLQDFQILIKAYHILVNSQQYLELRVTSLELAIVGPEFSSFSGCPIPGGLQGSGLQLYPASRACNVAMVSRRLLLLWPTYLRLTLVLKAISIQILVL